MIRRSDEAGMYLVGLLIVIAILGFLTYGYFDKGAEGVSSYNSAMDRTHAMDCDMNRNTMRMSLFTWQQQNPDKTPSIEALRSAMPPINIPPCRSGGDYTIAPNGEIFCSLHAPPPAPPATPTPASLTNFGPPPGQ